MPLSTRKEPYIIPNYSLTGDLLAFLRCPRQYRYYNRGALPPSAPVQFWFGEFIHGVMEEAFDRWKMQPGHQSFPWNWDELIRDIETTIFRRLAARGLTPPPTLFRPYRDDKLVDRRIASFRAEESINTWGPHFFPLIVEAEVRLNGTRLMPQIEMPRADYYGITGRVDVVSSIRLREAPPDNQLVCRLLDIPAIATRLKSSDQSFDVIIDYKGMRRPSHKASPEQGGLWYHQEWQVKTYAWLRKLQAPDREPVAGILLYLDELYPSLEDLRSLREEVKKEETDITPTGTDRAVLFGPLSRNKIQRLSAKFRHDRSIRTILIEPETLTGSLGEFDKVVRQIEIAVARERAGEAIKSAWQPNPDGPTCVACDFKYQCEGSRSVMKDHDYRVTVP